jgi:hypothetical protein
MSSNGERRPPRPEVILTSPTASAEEAAAIAAALERFLAENAPAAEAAETSRWQRAALLDGTRHAAGVEPWVARSPQDAC